MSKKQKKRRQEKPQKPAAAAQDSSPRRWTILAAIALAGVLLGIGLRRFTQPQPQVAANDVASTAAADPPEADSSKPAANSAAKNSAFDSILGKWVRSEGGYILDLRAVDAQGKLDAAYLNPRSIHVARAEATQPGTAIKVFIELQDVNYPGSTYDLTYDAASDKLTGVYFQAVEKQSFEVSFSRANEPR
jgi:hypothetical protein